MNDEIFNIIKERNKNLTDEEIEELLTRKLYFCPGNYEYLTEEERRKKIEQRDRNYQQILKEQEEHNKKYKKADK